MGVGPRATLVGGLIGAILGMGLHLLVEMTTGAEAPWFAVIIGLLTGLGVQQANKSLAGRVSYLRGAVTAAIALAAIVGSTPLISKVVAQRNARAAEGKRAAATAGDEKTEAPTDETASKGDEKVQTEPAADVPGAARGEVGVGNMGGPAPFNALQFVYMAVGTFLAYEFGRGSGPKAGVTPSSDTVVMTDPSN